MHKAHFGHAITAIVRLRIVTYVRIQTRPNAAHPSFRIKKMATVETTRPAPFGAITAFRVISKLDNLRTSLIAWNQTRLTQNTLSRLSDHELSDIGLSRGDIASIGLKNIR
jgi:uncharacterized protein YjiS (DUF1127 family)